MIKPHWLRKPPTRFIDTTFVREEIAKGGLNTVCSSARCPNMGECFSEGVATFMILGELCTRNCGFCSVEAGASLPVPDNEEPNRVARAAQALKLSHVVITSVTRDDLEDGGAGHFAKTIEAIRTLCLSSTIEALTPDFNGNVSAIDTVIKAGPDVFNHNVETVPRAYATVRPSADYKQSLALLAQVKQTAPSMMTKSGMMLGVGESLEEVVETMKDLRSVNCDIITLGQYLRPTKKHLKVAEYVRPETFEELKRIGDELGFVHVFSGPFVRSSYHAGEALKRITGQAQ